MSNYTASKSQWTNPNIDFIFGDDIIEYDIVDGGFSILKNNPILSNEEKISLSKMNKIDRHIAIGKMHHSHPQIGDILKQGFEKARETFIKENNINPSIDIISVKKDAIFCKKYCRRVNFDNIKFTRKNVYSSYIKLPSINNIELYYANNNIDIKGISDTSIDKHRFYLYEELINFFNDMESKNPAIKRKMIRFIDKYKLDELDEEFYLEFNNRSNDYDKMHNYINLLIPLIQIITMEWR